MTGGIIHQDITNVCVERTQEGSKKNFGIITNDDYVKIKRENIFISKSFSFLDLSIHKN